MNTKLLMTASAIFLGLTGIGLTFLPNEIAQYAGISDTETIQLILQVAGALYFGFAMLNWMAKGNIIGGIYNRPVAIANFSHFLIGGLALIKGLINHQELTYFIWILTGMYSIFGLLFGVVLFRHPSGEKQA